MSNSDERVVVAGGEIVEEGGVVMLGEPRMMLMGMPGWLLIYLGMMNFGR